MAFGRHDRGNADRQMAGHPPQKPRNPPLAERTSPLGALAGVDASGILSGGDSSGLFMRLPGGPERFALRMPPERYVEVLQNGHGASPDSCRGCPGAEGPTTSSQARLEVGEARAARTGENAKSSSASRLSSTSGPPW